jgi:hypothetical protein
MGSKAQNQPQDYSIGDGRSQGRGAPRRLIGPLAVLQVSQQIQLYPMSEILTPACFLGGHFIRLAAFDN